MVHRSQPPAPAGSSPPWVTTDNGQRTTDALAVRCRGVTKVFGDGDSKVQALAGVDLEVPFGEMTLLVGPSGCGKTTLISVIAGLLDASAGEVRVLGEDLGRMSGGRKTAFRSKNVG